MAGDIRWSGYDAAVADRLTTELNSLADAAVSALGTERDNTTDLATYSDLELNLASVTITSVVAAIDVYLVPTVDGTNYPDTVTTYANFMAGYYVGQFLVKAVSAAVFRGTLRAIPIPPGKYKWALRNRCGAALAASGNTLKERSYSEAYT
jgi:hypothetical protein